MDLITYALLKKKLSQSSAGVSDIQYKDGALVFILGDGSELSIDMPQDDFTITPEGNLQIETADGKQLLYEGPRFSVEDDTLIIEAGGQTISYAGPHYSVIYGGPA